MRWRGSMTCTAAVMAATTAARSSCTGMAKSGGGATFLRWLRASTATMALMMPAHSALMAAISTNATPTVWSARNVASPMPSPIQASGLAAPASSGTQQKGCRRRQNPSIPGE